MGENQGNGQGTLDLEPEKEREKEPETETEEEKSPEAATAEEEKTEPAKVEPEQSKKLLPALLATAVCTIGYTKKSAEQFFRLLKEAGVTVLFDIRANASFGISGYTFRRDFGYFCKLHEIELVVLDILAPDKATRDAYRRTGDWAAYEKSFIDLLNRRKAFANPKVQEALFEKDPGGVICFLCAESTADKCHRRLVVEHLLKFVPDADQITVIHL